MDVISDFHNELYCRVYENKLKKTYGHVISCFCKFSKTVSEVLIPVDKLKSVNPKRPYVSFNNSFSYKLKLVYASHLFL